MDARMLRHPPSWRPSCPRPVESSSPPLPLPASRLRRRRRRAAQLPGPRPSVGTPRTVRTPVLENAYEEHGPAIGIPVICLHGFPRRRAAYDGVAASLAGDGHRVLVALPAWLRPDAVPRARRRHASGQQAAIGQDLFDFVDALKHGPRGGRAASTGAGGRRASSPRCIPSVPRGGAHRRLLDPEHHRAAAARRARGRVQRLVPVVLQHRARPARPHGQSHAVLQVPVEAVVADLAASPTTTTTAPPRRSTTPTSSTWSSTCTRHRNVNAPSEPRFVDTEKALAARPPVQAPTVAALRG